MYETVTEALGGERDETRETKEARRQKDEIVKVEKMGNLIKIHMITSD